MEFLSKKITFTSGFGLALFLLILPMFVGPGIAIINPSFFGEIQSTLSMSIYIARNLAVGIVFILAIYWRNASMLFILILTRLITDLIDAPVFYLFKEPNLIGLIIIFSVFCYIPAIYALRYAWKNMTERKA